MTEATFSTEHRVASPGRTALTPGLERLAATTARFVWIAVVPVLSAAVLLRHAVPLPAVAAGTWAEPMASLVANHRFLAFVLLAVLTSGVARHFAGWIPAPVTRPAKRRAAGTLLVLAAAVALAAALRSLVGSYEVLSASMLPSLEPEDTVLGLRGALIGRVTESGVRVRRGDIVVFETPAGVEGPRHMVKRVVGLPGDRISMNGPHVVINGQEAPSCDAGAYFYPLSSGGGVAGRLHVEFIGDRPHLATVIPYEASWPETYEVKAGEVFVLGDNRSKSADSRSWNQGKGAGLPVSTIVGRVTTRLAGRRRDQHLDLSSLLRPLELDVGLDGIAASELRAGVAHCLSQRRRPAPTEPHAAP